jgi:hypothetical protein
VAASELVEQLATGARALGATDVEVQHINGWTYVAAHDDWFASAKFPVPEDFKFVALTPFPELGINSVRPECVVAAFARVIIVRGPRGVNVVKGSVSTNEPALVRMRESSAWGRAIAFRGVGGV